MSCSSLGSVRAGPRGGVDAVGGDGVFLCLQYGAEFPVLARKIAHMKFDPYGDCHVRGYPVVRVSARLRGALARDALGDENSTLTLRGSAKEMRR